MPEQEVKDNFVTLINFYGKPEQVWDFANHVEELLSKGWTRQEALPSTKRTINEETE